MKLAMSSLAVALAALLAATPASAGKKQTNAFSIAIRMECFYDAWGGYSDWSGTFKATGALPDSGSVTAPSYYVSDGYIQLEGKKGSLAIAVSNFEVVLSGLRGGRPVYKLAATFEIVGGTGAYAGLSGAGTMSGTGYSIPPHGSKGQGPPPLIGALIIEDWRLGGVLDGG
ncbi:MAG: hypothetical protein ACYSUM_22250 [Planctomycetota bacterium]|jgi:hypothetical protein